VKCPNCGKETSIEPRVYINLESYNVGGVSLAKSNCCGIGYLVRMQVIYELTPYEGNKTEDEWGQNIVRFQS